MTPDGKQIVASAPRDTENQILAVSTGDGEERTLASGDTPALSPDGAEVLYSVPGTIARIFARPTSGGQPRLVTELARRVYALAVEPDGTLHVGTAGENAFEAWRVPLAGGVPERDAPLPWFQIVPAPAGGWRAAIRVEGGLIVHILSREMSLDDPGARLLREVDHLAWEHDGASIVYAVGGNIHRLDVATGEDVVLFDVPTTGDVSVRGLAVSPDGKTIYFATDEGRRQSRRMLITNFGDRPRPR